jgi:hypothetical protein
MIRASVTVMNSFKSPGSPMPVVTARSDWHVLVPTLSLLTRSLSVTSPYSELESRPAGGAQFDSVLTSLDVNVTVHWPGHAALAT